MLGTRPAGGFFYLQIICLTEWQASTESVLCSLLGSSRAFLGQRVLCFLESIGGAVGVASIGGDNGIAADGSAGGGPTIISST